MSSNKIINPAPVRRRHAARVRDWRQRDQVRRRVWEAMNGPARAEIRLALLRTLARTLSKYQKAG